MLDFLPQSKESPLTQTNNHHPARNKSSQESETINNFSFSSSVAMWIAFVTLPPGFESSVSKIFCCLSNTIGVNESLLGRSRL